MEIGTERTESVLQTCLVSIMNPPTLWVQMRDLGVWRCKTWICFLACKPLIENITCWVFLAEGRPRGSDSRHRPHTTQSAKCIPHIYHTYHSVTHPQHSHPSNYQITLRPPQLQPHNPQIDTWSVESAWKTKQKTWDAKTIHDWNLNLKEVLCSTTHSFHYNV